MTNYRPSWAEIDLRNLDYNFRLVKKIVGPKIKILVPVKAHGYGHGLIPVSKRLEKLGVDYLGVASIDEGIVLRNAGVTKPILILGSILPGDIEPILRYRLTQAISTMDVAEKLNQAARSENALALVHIKVDTGMHRMGVYYEEAYNFIKYIAGMDNIRIEGIFTHFPCAEEDTDFTKKQIEIFGSLIKRLEEAGINIPLRHAANSLGVIDYPLSHFNLVRPGLMVYGLYPKQGIDSISVKLNNKKVNVKLRPLLTLKTKIVHINTVSAGKGVSYGYAYITSRQTRIATLAMGYGDGYPRCLSNKAYCLIGGRRAKIVGNICMDQMMADITGIKNVAVGQEAVLIGRQDKESVTAEELAQLAGTIPYEIVCDLGTRLSWVYKE